MARAGRKAKSGKREPNGQLSRKQQARVVFDPGSDATRAKMSVYGTDGSDAIGRAFAMGLLGEHGMALRDTARAIHRAYWPALGVGQIAGTLGNRTSGSALADRIDPTAQARTLAREQWLVETLREVDRMGPRIRRAFDQLCIDINPDCGPMWLDRMIGMDGAGPCRSSDVDQLNTALQALIPIALRNQRPSGGVVGGNDGGSNFDLWFGDGDGNADT